MLSTTQSEKTLSSHLIRTLSSQNRDIFTINDAREITNTSNVATRVLLGDLVARKLLIRLVPGKYLIVPLSAGVDAQFSENWYVVAKNLIEPNPYYLSHYSALDIHEMTTQPLMTIYTTTTVRRETRRLMGASFQFVNTKQTRLWGIEDAWVKQAEKVKVSDLERTIIDCLDNPKLCGGVSELAKGLWQKRNEIDFTKLLEYVDRFDSKAVAKRLGFLLDLYGISADTPHQLRKFVSASYVRLDPSLPDKGKYQSEWRLRINLDPDELLTIIRT